MGYVTYVDLIRPLLGAVEIIVSGMRDEVRRCRMAIDRALAGERVALVCSGDVGIYGLAGLVLEICCAQGLKPGPPDTLLAVDFFYEVIPGAPALTAAASLLGAPLMHDFAVISLSDLLTPWDLIAKRVTLAAQGDLVVVLYNPKSKKRDWQLSAVQDLLLQERQPETPVGIVTRAMRPGQEVMITALQEMAAHPVDMQTLIIVGNSQTYVYGSYMVTPRGYGEKYSLGDGEQ
jgi:precorrin-3B C17-methyltransferase